MIAFLYQRSLIITFTLAQINSYNLAAVRGSGPARLPGGRCAPSFPDFTHQRRAIPIVPSKHRTSRHLGRRLRRNPSSSPSLLRDRGRVKAVIRMSASACSNDRFARSAEEAAAPTGRYPEPPIPRQPLAEPRPRHEPIFDAPHHKKLLGSVALITGDDSAIGRTRGRRAGRQRTSMSTRTPMRPRRSRRLPLSSSTDRL